jgi:hypothetical protein
MIFTSICNASETSKSDGVNATSLSGKPENGSPARKGYVRRFFFFHGIGFLERIALFTLNVIK